MLLDFGQITCCLQAICKIDTKSSWENKKDKWLLQNSQSENINYLNLNDVGLATTREIILDKL